MRKQNDYVEVGAKLVRGLLQKGDVDKFLIEQLLQPEYQARKRY